MRREELEQEIATLETQKANAWRDFAASMRALLIVSSGLLAGLAVALHYTTGGLWLTWALAVLGILANCGLDALWRHHRGPA